MSRASRDRDDAVKQVEEKYKVGDRLMCRKNGKTYQMGSKHSGGRFWMLCEDDNEKGLVEARVIVREFSGLMTEVR